MQDLKKEIVKLFELTGDLNTKVSRLLADLPQEVLGEEERKRFTSLISELLSGVIEIGARSQMNEREVAKEVGDALRAFGREDSFDYSKYKSSLSDGAFQHAMNYLRFWYSRGVDLPDSIEELNEGDKYLQFNWFVTYSNPRRNANVRILVHRDFRIIVQNNVMYPYAGVSKSGYITDAKMFDHGFFSDLGLAAGSWQSTEFNPLRHLPR